MWTYVQSSGELWQGSFHVGTGYSGFDAGRNQPSMQAVRGVGPIPRGLWTILGPPQNIVPGPGIYVLRLTPSFGTPTFGRSEFLLHGEAGNHPGCVSHCCIVMPHDARVAVWTSGDRTLEVIDAILDREGTVEA